MTLALIDGLPALPNNFWAFVGMVFMGIMWLVVKPLLAEFFATVKASHKHQEQLQEVLSNHFKHDEEFQLKLLEGLNRVVEKLDEVKLGG